MKVVILARSPGKNIHFEVGSVAVTLGRSDTVHVQVNDSNCSRTHCKFSLEGAKLWVEDLGSKNGTTVNGMRIEKAQMFMGDKVIVGDTEISISVDRNSDAITRMLHFDGDTQERQKKSLHLQDTSEHIVARHQPISTIKNFSLEASQGKKAVRETKKEIEVQDPPAWMTFLASFLDYGGILIAIALPLVFAQVFDFSTMLFGLDAHFSAIKKLTVGTGISLFSGFIFWLMNTKNAGGTLGERFLDSSWYDRQKKG